MDNALQDGTASAGRTVGWVGAGKMGSPMARRLLSNGINVLVTEPDAGAREALTQAGAVASDRLDGIGTAGVVFSTLPHDAALRAVVLGSGDSAGLAKMLHRGAILVEMSTVSPDCSSEVARALAEAGIRYVRAPISGSTVMAGSGALTVLASGDAGAWAEVQPLIALISARQFFLGPGEEARYMKLVLNTLVGASSAILAEALSLGESGGLSRGAMMDVICESAVASPLFRYKTDLVVQGDYTPAFTIGQMMKDFTLISDAGRANGVPLMTAGLILEIYRSAANAGMLDEDFFALLKWHAGISAQ